MIDESPISFSRQLSVRSTSIRIAVTDSDQIRAVYELPPLMEIIAIQSLSAEKVSIDETVQAFSSATADTFYEEYLKLSKQAERFSESPTYLNHLSFLLQKAGRLDDAEKYLEEAAKRSNDAGYLRSKLAVARLKKSVDTESISEIEKIASSDNPHAALNLALAWLFKREFAKALSVADRMISADPLSYDARLLRGSLHLISGKPHLALRDLRTALEERPNSAVSYANIGVAYLLLRNVRKAVESVRRANLLNPADKNVVALLADLYDSTGQHDMAIRILSNYLEFDQKEGSLWDRLAKAHYQIGQYNDAMRVLQHEASVKDDYAVWNNMALVAWADGSKTKARQFFNHALSKANADRTSEILLSNYLQFLDATGEHKDLLSLSSRMVDENFLAGGSGDEAHSRIVLHHISGLHNVGRYLDAARIAELYLHKHPEDSLVALNLCSYLLFYYSLNTKNEGKVLQHSSRARRMLDRLPLLMHKAKLRLINNLTYAYLEIGALDDAVDCFAPARPYIEADPFLLATLGLLQFKSGHQKEGIANYRRALNTATSVTLRKRLQQKMHLELGRYHALKGNTKKARVEFIEAITIKTGNVVFGEEAKRELAALD